MVSNMTRERTRKGRRRADPHEQKLQRSLDRYGLYMIKVVGVVGTALGLVIIIAFWYWVLGKLFSI
jgi:Tfp pilus assembly protein PilP